jgi:hypothetical protein
MLGTSPKATRAFYDRTEAMPERAYAAQQPASLPAAVRRLPARGGRAERLLALQRTAGNRAVGRALQRSLSVRDPAQKIPNPGGTGVDATNAATIEGYLQNLCSVGAVAVDGTSGLVSMKKGFCDKKDAASPSAAESSATPTGCGCLCDMTLSANDWSIVVDDAEWPHTKFANHKKSEKKGGTGGKVTAPSPNSDKLWGAATVSGAALDFAPWLVLGHELCGHGWLGDRGLHAPDVHKKRGEGGHQATVDRENLIRDEHKIERRGGFKDPFCGESYFRLKADPTDEHWSESLKVCKKWREKYNKKHKTKYKIEDRIP